MLVLDKFRSEKSLFFILLIIVALGIFLRLNDFSEVQYWNDDVSTIPTGLLGFYPYSVYPGMAGQGEPILGNVIIGAGCLLSGEDFSGVSQVGQMFYPGREVLIGQQLVNAFPFCHIPMYIFGILFFLIITLLSLNLLDKYASLFAISFFAFYPRLLQLSRWIHVDIFGYFFVALGLLFLWYAYISERDRKEILFFFISFVLFALAFSTKLPNGIFLAFAGFILLEKYKEEVFQIFKKFFQIFKKIGIKIDMLKKTEPLETNPLRLIKIGFLSLLVYIFVVLIPLYFKPQNLIDLIRRYQSTNIERSSINFNTGFFTDIFHFLLTLNVIDLLFFALSLVVLVRLLIAKKTQKEKFILSLVTLLFLLLLFFETLTYVRIFIVFSFGLVFLMSLAFSNRKYSLLNLFKIKKKLPVVILLLLVYVSFSFFTALSSSPRFDNLNPLICDYSIDGCHKDKITFVQRDIATYLIEVMADDETFYWPRSDVLNYYVRPEEAYPKFQFDQFFFQQIGRYPTPPEQIEYFRPNDRRTRYVVLSTFVEKRDDPFIVDLKENFNPNKVIYSNKEEASWIYDLDNLQKKD